MQIKDKKKILSFSIKYTLFLCLFVIINELIMNRDSAFSKDFFDRLPIVFVMISVGILFVIFTNGWITFRHSRPDEDDI
jgi:hypothetical protein